MKVSSTDAATITFTIELGFERILERNTLLIDLEEKIIIYISALALSGVQKGLRNFKGIYDM